MRKPLDNYTLTQGFQNSSIYYGNFGITRNGGYFHDGWDMAGPLGTPVVAPESGSVYQGWEPNGYGHYIVLHGTSGWVHELGHLQGFAKGGNVSEGDVIGYRGTSGNSTGSHTHWTTIPPNPDKGNGTRGAVDPQVFLNQGGTLPHSDAEFNQVVREREELRNYSKQSNYKVAQEAYLLYEGREATDAEARAWIDTYPVDKIVNGIAKGRQPLTSDAAQKKVQQIRSIVDAN